MVTEDLLSGTATSPSALATRWELYRVLAEPVRLRLLALAAAEELTIGELADILGESQSNVSRHVAPLKQALLVSVRRQGTRALVRLGERTSGDPVVNDALASGRALCEEDGSFARIAEVLRARDAVGRDFFARPRGSGASLAGNDGSDVAAYRFAPAELAAYLSALAPLIAHRGLALDVGTGDGGLLDVLAPVFHRVIGVDRSATQLGVARERVKSRGYANVDLYEGELTDPALRERCGPNGGADVVFGVRLLHHAPRPADVVAQLAALVRPGGHLVVLDYARHDDESMRDQADLWLGFEPPELGRFAAAAGLGKPHVARVLAPQTGPDAHLPWQVMVAKKNS
jgi:ArsR family transcriptional regulator